MLKQYYYYYSSSSSSSLSMNAIMSSSASATWEEKAFAEDAAGALGGGGCIWPPRSYSCSFCMREFRSAQALGGHMNVHRRDRARLKQCLHNSIPTPNLAKDQVSHHSHASMMMSYPFSSPRAFLSPFSSSNPSSVEEEDQSITMGGGDQVGSYVETDLRVGLVRGGSQLAKGCCGEEASSVKRAKIGCDDDRNSSAPFTLFLQREEVSGLVANSMEDVDLELRLGEPTTPKVK